MMQLKGTDRYEAKKGDKDEEKCEHCHMRKSCLKLAWLGLYKT